MNNKKERADCVENLNWSRLGLHPSEMQFVLVDREVRRLNMVLRLLQPSVAEESKRRVLFGAKQRMRKYNAIMISLGFPLF